MFAKIVSRLRRPFTRCADTHDDWFRRRRVRCRKDANHPGSYMYTTLEAAVIWP
jgi:hypothetical protein